MTYEPKLDELWQDENGRISYFSAKSVLNDADYEIAKLKELLKVAICYIQENDPLTEKIEEALKDE